MTMENKNATYGAILADGGFQSFLWTQFLGAFNDNVYKMIVSLVAVETAKEMGGTYLALAGVVFVVPFMIFAGYAGQLADRFSKTRVLQITKSLEIATMLLGIAALVSHNIYALLAVLFLLATQANFFSPAKYGILPECMTEGQLSRANGLLELSTFIAIVIGTSFGTLLYEHWKTEPLRMGVTLLGIAVIGSLASLRITKVPSAGSREPFHWNPLAEIAAGARSLRNRRSLWLTVLGISWFWFVGALFQMGLLLEGKEVLHVSEARVGLLVTALAIGIGVGSVAAGRLSGDHIELGLVPMGSALMGAFAIALGLTHNYTAALVWLAGLGFAGGLFIVPLNAFIQERAAANEKGRVLATNNFSNSLGIILSSGMLWLLHDQLHWSPATIILALGIAIVIATFYVIYLLPDIAARFVIWCVTHCRFRIRIEGAENIPESGGALLVSNHVSYADAVLLGCTTSRMIRFLMWRPYYEHKLLRPIFQLLHAIPVGNDSPKAMLRSLIGAREQLAAGELIGIFPEGSITRSGQVEAFQRGFERITGDSGAPIIPIYIDGLYGHPLSLRGGKLFAKLPKLRRADVTIQIGEPIYNAITPEALREKVLDLSLRAAASRKTADATLAHRFVRAARNNWSSLAIADSTGMRLTFGQALTAALLMRRWLRTEEHRAERFIGILLPSSAAGAVANLGVTLAGKGAVNLNFTAGEESMRSAIARCNLRTILTSRKFAEKVKVQAVFIEDVTAGFSAFAKLRAYLAARFAPIRINAHPDDTAAVIFSSGSTGEPKGVELTHWNLLSNIDSVAQIYDVGRGDVMLGALPFFHSFGYTFTLWFPLVREFGAVFHANPIDGRTIGELAAKHHATFLLSTPTFCTAYLRQCSRDQFSALRYVLVGAEKLRPSLAQSFHEKFGVTPVEGYGIAYLLFV